MVGKELLWKAICATTLCSIFGCEQLSSRMAEESAAVPSAVALTDPPQLQLDYHTFDQTPGQGWRKLADQNDHLGAAKLIDTYIERHEELKEWQRINLCFHAGQLFAFAGEETTAMSRFNASINSIEPEDSPLRWNAYVRATLAFLGKDREQLIKMRDEIAQGPEFQGSVPNLDVVDRLIENFDQPYSIAYGIRENKSGND